LAKGWGEATKDRGQGGKLEMAGKGRGEKGRKQDDWSKDRVKADPEKERAKGGKP